MITHQTLNVLVILAGVAQIVLILASLAIPGVLGWREETARLRTLTRQVFWTYAGYIWSTNLAFGVFSAFGSRLIIDGSPLGTIVAGYMAAYWTARLVIQLFVFDTSEVTRGGGWHRLAELMLTLLFITLTSVYLAAAILPAAGLLSGTAS